MMIEFIQTKTKSFIKFLCLVIKIIFVIEILIY